MASIRTARVLAAVSALAASASAAPHGTPYALGAVHADFQAQLEGIAGTPGEVGAAARVAADLIQAGRQVRGTLLPAEPERAALAREAEQRARHYPNQDGLRIEANLSTLAYQTEDAAEGMAAFLAKRKPVFRDR